MFLKLYLTWPDENHVAWCTSEGDDEGSDDWESQEVREHPVTVVSVMALTRTGRKVASNADAATVREDLGRHADMVAHTHTHDHEE